MTPERAARLAELIATMPALDGRRRKPRTIKLARVRAPGPVRPPRPPAVLPIVLEIPPPVTRGPRTVRIGIGQVRPVKPPPAPAVLPIVVELPPRPSSRRPRRLKIAVGVDRPPGIVRPEKPRADFPLRAHCSGQWVYPLGRGRYVYCGRWYDPAAGVREGSLRTCDPSGRMWRRALTKFENWKRENLSSTPAGS